MSDMIINRISEVKQNATKSQKILINYLLTANFNEVIYLSITELAEITGVGEATILRFCRLLGFKGYQEFKLSMAQEMAGTGGNGNDETYIAAICDNIVSILNMSKSEMSLEKIDKAVDLMTEAEHISVFGVGNSYVPALELHNRLLKMGIYSQCEHDAHLQNMLISSFGERDCVVLFSVSGGTKDVIDVAEIARANGVKVIVVTSYDKSPLVKYADAAVVSIRRESPLDGGSMLTKIVQLYVVDVLCTGIYRRDRNTTGENIKKANRSVVDKLV